MSCDEDDIWEANVVFFFVVLQLDTSKCDNKKPKIRHGVKGLNWPLLFFLNVVVSKKNTNHAPRNML